VSENKSLRDPGETAGFLSEILKQGRLIRRLLADRRVSIWPKLIIPATVAYIVSPIDLLSDVFLGVGQLDDIAVLLIGLKVFVELCPTEIVQEHLDDLSSVISGSYRVVAEQTEHEQASQAQTLEGREEGSQAGLPEGSSENNTGNNS
jgi:uncharacterized membrane protein YkvA (DUF1232 family)